MMEIAEANNWLSLTVITWYGEVRRRNTLRYLWPTGWCRFGNGAKAQYY